MDRIEVEVLNSKAEFATLRKNLAFAARLTQRGPKMTNMDSVKALYQTPMTDALYTTLVGLPHPTIQKFGTIEIVVVGASRRFLQQVTRHQNEVKFMSASLQYAEYPSTADFVVPFEVLCHHNDAKAEYYHDSVKQELNLYSNCCKAFGHDAGAYAAPMALRNAILISATPYQWKHMISQRVCGRNTMETQYVFLKIWEQLYNNDPILFAPSSTGPQCGNDAYGSQCHEGKGCCLNSIAGLTPSEALSKLYKVAQQ